jgi:N-acetylglucosamine-6-phosphate deacetylase
VHRTGRDTTGSPISIRVEAGAIAGREAGADEDDALLAPALVDIQLNGYAGVGVKSDDPDPEDLLRMARAVWATGVGSFVPTVTTDSRDRIAGGIRRVVSACAQDPRFALSVPGIHIEGPYISRDDGPRGAHPIEHVRAPDWDEYSRWQDAADGAIRILTLSPEWDGSASFIERVADTGVVVALGHTQATAEQIDDAVRAGAMLSTHLGNGAHSILPRHPNYIWHQLAEDRLWASFIADGHHLPAATFKAMLRAKTLDRAVLTSDAVMFAGMPAGTYGDDGAIAVDLLENGRVQLAGTPYLAGAGLPLVRGVENAVRFADIPLAAAWRLAAHNPARLLGLDDRGALQPGARGDFVRCAWDSEACRLDVRETVVAGEVVYAA